MFLHLRSPHLNPYPNMGKIREGFGGRGLGEDNGIVNALPAQAASFSRKTKECNKWGLASQAHIPCVDGKCRSDFAERLIMHCVNRGK